jgi:hypothetical protein
MAILGDFLDWAWARHASPFSWYIRPLFILPFCDFAYKKSVREIVVTLVAVTTSMFWFPAPATPDPHAVALLDMERRYVGGPLMLERIVLTTAHSYLVRRVGMGGSKTLSLGSDYGDRLGDAPEGSMALP